VPVNLAAPNSNRPEKMYMETPCNHTFHPSCLEEWMNYKRQCPVCRAELPPIKDTD